MKIGDLVRSTFGATNGKIGIIVDKNVEDDKLFLVRFFDFAGHTGNERNMYSEKETEDHWFMFETELEKIRYNEKGEIEVIEEINLEELDNIDRKIFEENEENWIKECRAEEEQKLICSVKNRILTIEWRF